jgi:hypothetical protein
MILIRYINAFLFTFLGAKVHFFFVKESLRPKKSIENGQKYVILSPLLVKSWSLSPFLWPI